MNLSEAYADRLARGLSEVEVEEIPLRTIPPEEGPKYLKALEFGLYAEQRKFGGVTDNKVHMIGTWKYEVLPHVDKQSYSDAAPCNDMTNKFYLTITEGDHGMVTEAEARGANWFAVANIDEATGLARGWTMHLEDAEGKTVILESDDIPEKQMTITDLRRVCQGLNRMIPSADVDYRSPLVSCAYPKVSSRSELTIARKSPPGMFIKDPKPIYEAWPGSGLVLISNQHLMVSGRNWKARFPDAGLKDARVESDASITASYYEVTAIVDGKEITVNSKTLRELK